jgi:hypothetical protein
VWRNRKEIKTLKLLSEQSSVLCGDLSYRDTALLQSTVSCRVSVLVLRCRAEQSEWLGRAKQSRVELRGAERSIVSGREEQSRE